MNAQMNRTTPTAVNAGAVFPVPTVADMLYNGMNNPNRAPPRGDGSTS